ncbi:hypothetical protein J6590_098978 [Homalodisca vitripennis]|nr:hypothetical protein J6590_098978 [Homalodisca vitripennis]
MPEKYGESSKDLVGGESLPCVECKYRFHFACVLSSGSTQNITETTPRSWTCELCRCATASLRNNKDDKKSIFNDPESDSIAELTKELMGLHARVQLVEDQLQRVNTQLNYDIRELRVRLQDIDQLSRSANLEIHGVSKTTGEDNYEVLDNINVPYKHDEISVVYRMRLFSSRDCSPPSNRRPVYISEREGPLDRSSEGKERTGLHINFNPTSARHNKALLVRAKRLMKERKLHFAGFFNGKVLVCDREGDEAVRVTTMGDLDRYGI